MYLFLTKPRGRKILAPPTRTWDNKRADEAQHTPVIAGEIRGPLSENKRYLETRPSNCHLHIDVTWAFSWLCNFVMWKSKDGKHRENYYVTMSLDRCRWGWLKNCGEGNFKVECHHCMLTVAVKCAIISNCINMTVHSFFPLNANLKQFKIYSIVRSFHFSIGVKILLNVVLENSIVFK